jgi:hypothetical protein
MRSRRKRSSAARSAMADARCSARATQLRRSGTALQRDVLSDSHATRAASGGGAASARPGARQGRRAWACASGRIELRVRLRTCAARRAALPRLHFNILALAALVSLPGRVHCASHIGMRAIRSGVIRGTRRGQACDAKERRRKRQGGAPWDREVRKQVLEDRKVEERQLLGRSMRKASATATSGSTSSTRPSWPRGAAACARPLPPP